jgi:hypothetical protein
MLTEPLTRGSAPGAYGQALLQAAQEVDPGRLFFRRLQCTQILIDAWFSDADYADLCARNLALRPATGDAPPDMTVYLLDAESLGWPQPQPWPASIFDRQTMARELSVAGLRGGYLHDPRVWQFFDVNAGLGVQLVRRPGATGAWESGSPLRSFLHWGHSQRGMQLCHAGTVGRDGNGVLLVGAGGSGKSGTTLAAVAAGLDTVGDDYCLVGQSEAGVVAYPLFHILKQDPGGVRRALGDAATASFGPLNWQGKYEIHAEMLERDPFVEGLRIRAIVLPRIAGAAQSSFLPVPAGQAMRALAPSSSFQLPDGEREGIAFAASLCRRLPCVEMALSGNAAEIAAALDRFVMESGRDE